MKATFFQLCHPHPSDHLAYPAVKTDPLCPCHAVWHDSHLLSIWFWSSASSYLTSHQMVVPLWVTLRGPTERMVGNEYWTCCAVNGMGHLCNFGPISNHLFDNILASTQSECIGLDWIRLMVQMYKQSCLESKRWKMHWIFFIYLSSRCEKTRKMKKPIPMAKSIKQRQNNTLTSD